MSVSRPPATPALPKELVSFSPSVADRARGFPGSVPGDQDPPADIVEMPGIGDDQHWPSGGERNLLRTRPDQLRFGAIGIELAEDRQIGIAGVQRRARITKIWKVAVVGAGIGRRMGSGKSGSH
jgi:hypothetical protein